MTLTLMEIVLSDDKIVIVIFLEYPFAPIQLSQILSAGIFHHTCAHLNLALFRNVHSYREYLVVKVGGKYVKARSFFLLWVLGAQPRVTICQRTASMVEFCHVVYLPRVCVMHVLVSSISFEKRYHFFSSLSGILFLFL
jgi:hypothetical protein